MNASIDSASKEKVFWKRIVHWCRPEHALSQYFVYVAGCVVFSWGASCFIASKLGTDPLDVLSLALRDRWHVTVGMAQAGIAALFLGIWAVWNRRPPLLSPFLTFAFCGSLIDLWLYTHWAERLPISRMMLMLTGVLVCAYGSALVVMSGIGIRSMDLLAITALYRWKVPFWAAKGVLEVVLLVSGWLLGGTVGIGTFAFLACVGWMIQPLMYLNYQVFGIPNYGIAAQQEREEEEEAVPAA